MSSTGSCSGGAHEAEAYVQHHVALERAPDLNVFRQVCRPTDHHSQGTASVRPLTTASQGRLRVSLARLTCISTSCHVNFPSLDCPGTCWRLSVHAHHQMQLITTTPRLTTCSWTRTCDRFALSSTLRRSSKHYSLATARSDHDHCSRPREK